MSARIKQRLWRIIVAVVLFAAMFVTFHFVQLPEKLWFIELSAYLIVYVLVAYDVLWRSEERR